MYEAPIEFLTILSIQIASKPTTHSMAKRLYITSLASVNTSPLVPFKFYFILFLLFPSPSKHEYESTYLSTIPPHPTTRTSNQPPLIWIRVSQPTIPTFFTSRLLERHTSRADCRKMAIVRDSNQRFWEMQDQVSAGDVASEE